MLEKEFHQQLSPKANTFLNPCGLKSGCVSCQGKGYILRGEWGYVESETCSCLRNCRQCAGSGKLLQGAYLKGCRSPSPLLISQLINKAKIPARYSKASVDLFANASPSGVQLQKLVKNWIAEFASKKRPKGLIISGPVGVGKTYILCAMAFALIEQRISVKFVDFFQLLADIKAAYSEGGSDKKLIEPLVKADVLFIDELGKGRNIEWEQTILDQIVNGRYNRSKVIVCTTNYSCGSDKVMTSQSKFNRHLDEEKSFATKTNSNFDSLLNRVGPRIYSRLCEMSDWFSLAGHDHRR